MKAVIITEASKSTGLGHIGRCLCLGQAFRDKSVSLEFIVNSDVDLDNLLEGKTFQIFNWLKDKDNLKQVIKDADLAILDSYHVDDFFCQFIAELVRLPVYIDDGIKAIDYPRGVVINSSIVAKATDYDSKQGLVYLVGSKYALLPDEFSQIPEKTISEDLTNIMITFGGADPANMTPVILGLLQQEFPQLIKNVVIGRGFSNLKEIEYFDDSKINLIYYPDFKQMKNLMLEADVVISAGGQTLYELAAVGVPAVVIAVARNQLANVKAWQEANYIEYAGYYNSESLLENVLSALKRLNDKDLRTEKSLLARGLIDSGGSKRIVNYLLGNLV